jgi:hypothetical protein
MKTIHFEVADFETAYNASLGRLALSKFMAIPHYTYLVLNMPGSHISIRGDVKRAFDCDRESCKTTDSIHRTPRVEVGLGRVPPIPGHAQGQDFQDVHPTGGHTQQDDSVVRGGAFQGCS